MPHRKPLLATALLLALIKSIQLAVDAQVLFYDDSGAFLLNALSYGFIPERSYVYGALIRIFAVTVHSLRAIVVMQVVMGAITSWLLAFILMRYLSVRVWIAILAAVAFALDPVQIVHEHLIMTETTTMLAVALFLAGALQYLRDLSLRRLIGVSLVGILLVSLRIVYVPVLLACAVLLPLGAYFAAGLKNRKALITALIVSCGVTLALHLGYRSLTGLFAGREAAYHYRTGDFLVTLVSPLIKPEDTRDARVADAIRAQNQSDLPLTDPSYRTRQMWTPEGFVARLRPVFHDDAKEANRAEDKLARAAILRDPWGFVRLGFHTYFDYWREVHWGRLKLYLAKEHGSPRTPVVSESGGRMIAAIFGVDVSNQHLLHTPSRRYHLFAADWNLVLMVSPLLAALAFLCARPFPSPGAATLFAWSLLLFVATFWGASEVGYRYLHPFSFTTWAALAMLLEAGLSSTKSSHLRTAISVTTFQVKATKG